MRQTKENKMQLIGGGGGAIIIVINCFTSRSLGRLVKLVLSSIWPFTQCCGLINSSLELIYEHVKIVSHRRMLLVIGLIKCHYPFLFFKFFT